MPSPSAADTWIAERMGHIEASGIRKVFELARSLKDPVNLSIGQPDFDVPEPIKAAAHAAIDRGPNAYTVTQGIPELRAKIQADVHAALSPRRPRGLHHQRHQRRTGARPVLHRQPRRRSHRLRSRISSCIRTWSRSPAARTVYVDTYPDFRIDMDRVRAALTPRTKAILVNSPANPTGRVYRRDVLRDLAKLARERGVLLMSDEVYRVFCYDEPFASPAEFNEDVLVFDGFSKAYGMTGWRLGFAHGPRRLIEEMIKLQQFTLRLCRPAWCSTPASPPGITMSRASSPTIAASATGSYEGLEGSFRIGRAGRGVLPVPEGAVRQRHRVRR